MGGIENVRNCDSIRLIDFDILRIAAHPLMRILPSEPRVSINLMENTYDSTVISDISSVLKILLNRFENMSGSELAKRTGLPISTVNRILAGSVSDPRISTLKPLANYFGITVDQLLGYTALPEEF